MKRVRNLLSLAASLVLVFTVLFLLDTETVNAAGNVTKLEISSVKGYAGDTVTVTVSLTENPGIAGGSFRVNYDKSVLKINDPEADVTTSNDTVPASAGAMCRKDGDGFVGYSFAGTSNFTGTGTIFTIKFEIIDSAALGDTVLTFTNQETSNDSLEAVDVQVTNGKVTVECRHAQTESVVTTEATCTQAGTKTLTCTNCGQTVSTEQIPALGHDLGEYTVTKEATCTEKGEETAKCKRCDESETREIPALGHDLGEYTVTKEATCTEKGEETAKCKRCDGSETREIPALGHRFGEYAVTREATDTEEGELTAVCVVDGIAITKAIPVIKKEDFQILNSQGEAVAEYIEHTEAVFTVKEQGMDNGTPVAGDVRYIPAEWTLGSASGSWAAAPYSATVALGDKGNYVLTVVYKRQIFNDGEWKEDAKTYTNTVSILVKEQEEDADDEPGEPLGQTQGTEQQNVTATSPKTGDSSQAVILLMMLVCCCVLGAGFMGYIKWRREGK